MRTVSGVTPDLSGCQVRSESGFVEQTGMKPTQHKTGKSDSFWVRQIRKEYRNYMKLCQETGISIKASTTSRDLQENHERNPQICGQCQELRQIYLDARYGQRADFQSAKRFREVYKERDLQENHERNPQICGQCQELRQIYLDARYGQRADFQSAKRFREVYKEIKKKL